MDIRESALGAYPCLTAGAGRPMVVLAGLTPEPGVAPGPMRRTHELTVRGWARNRTVYYLNRRPGLPSGMTMAALAAEHAQALRDGFSEPVDVVGMSTGGSIAQQLAAEHPDVVCRLALISTACRLGLHARRLQRQIAARVRAGAARQALAVSAGALAPPPVRLPAACLGWWFGHACSRPAGCGTWPPPSRPTTRSTWPACRPYRARRCSSPGVVTGSMTTACSSRPPI